MTAMLLVSDAVGGIAGSGFIQLAGPHGGMEVRVLHPGPREVQRVRVGESRSRDHSGVMTTRPRGYFGPVCEQQAGGATVTPLAERHAARCERRER